MVESCMLSEYHSSFFKKQLHACKMLYEAIQSFSFSSNTVRSTVTLNIQFQNNILEKIFTESYFMNNINNFLKLSSRKRLTICLEI